MTFNMRLATVEDVERICEIEVHAFPPSEAASKEKYIWRLKHFPEYFFVIEDEEHIVGITCMIPTEMKVIKDDIFEMDILPKGDVAAILSVMTTEDYRGQGVAATILSFAIEQMRARGMTSMCLTCKEHLLHYYAKFGFEKIGVSASVHGGAVWYDMIKIL